LVTDSIGSVRPRLIRAIHGFEYGDLRVSGAAGSGR
jgi:hypothetical protein